jgi:hypothetical protein
MLLAGTEEPHSHSTVEMTKIVGADEGAMMTRSGDGVKKSGDGGARNMNGAGGNLEKRFAGCDLETRINERRPATGSWARE